MTIAVARLTSCFAAQIDGVDVARFLDEEKGQLGIAREAGRRRQSSRMIPEQGGHDADLGQP
jgi:hypothetical protein